MPSIKKHISKGLIAVIAAVGGGCLEATTDLIKQNFGHALAEVRNVYEDHFSPLPTDASLGINLRVFIPKAQGTDVSEESVSATIPGTLCLQPGGHRIVRAFDEEPNGHQTNAMMNITCRASGRVSVALSPQSGQTVQIYDGRFKDGDKVAFPGVPHSYYAGLLTMYRLDAVQPEGEWEDINQ